ncbi:hypothetical protein CEXT_709031 [Caerostris extrusa]|uniref:Uncharacterized protein n=1 Tax=Caerostris extrusa TaxID=172846 RepID=A0AAV4NIZ6_CAEEX|nr:hypothetical protein CEXT_709031 [Caerostris extrusa]
MRGGLIAPLNISDAGRLKLAGIELSRGGLGSFVVTRAGSSWGMECVPCILNGASDISSVSGQDLSFTLGPELNAQNYGCS